MQPNSVQRANALIPEEINETGYGGQCRHHETCAEQPDRCCGPDGISSLPVDQVAYESRHKESDGERDEHRVDGMSGDARRTLWIRHGDLHRRIPDAPTLRKAPR